MRLVLMLILPIVTACGRSAVPTHSVPATSDAVHYAECFDGVAFIPTSLDALNASLPSGFVARDGSLLGNQFKGSGLLAVLYLSCPKVDGSWGHRVFVATPIEAPSLASDLRAVEWHWYEYERFVDTEEQAVALRTQGFSARVATMSNAPFMRDGSEASFVIEVAGDTAAVIHGLVESATESPAQSHRAWHVSADGRLLTTRWDFRPHHSRWGSIDSCTLRPDLLVRDVAGAQCARNAMMEAIAAIEFDEQVTQWK